MTSLITSLHQSLEITPLDGDQVKVTVTLPSELLSDYQSLLESLTGFVNAINHRKHLERLKAASDQTRDSSLTAHATLSASSRILRLLPRSRSNPQRSNQADLSQPPQWEPPLVSLWPGTQVSDRSWPPGSTWKTSEAVMTSCSSERANKAAALYDRPTDRARLVTCPISQTFSDDYLELYPVSIRRKRPFTGPPPEPPERSNTTIQGFSKKSRSRLRFTAANSDDKIKTQFCMTYADVWPINGRSLKADLNRFLTSVKKTFTSLEYIWIAELQTRGCPHFHFFSNIELTTENHEILTRKWHKVAGYGQAKHLRVHGHQSNFIEWSMGNGSYLCKYLDKEHQKVIPEGFYNFGRFWGNSRKLVPDPTTEDLQTFQERYEIEPQIDEYGEILNERDPVKLLMRTLGKHHEKYNKRSFLRRTNRSITHITGRKIYEQLTEYWRKEDEQHVHVRRDFKHDNVPVPVLPSCTDVPF